METSSNKPTEDPRRNALRQGGRRCRVFDTIEAIRFSLHGPGSSCTVGFDLYFEDGNLVVLIKPETLKVSDICWDSQGDDERKQR